MSEQKPDVVIVAPGNHENTYQNYAPFTAKEPPVWAGLNATFLERKGFSVEIIDANAEDLPPIEVAKRIKDINPHLVVIPVYGHQPNASTHTMPAAGAIAREVKELLPEQKVVLLGGHVATLPERTLQEEKADFVCTGEGPYALYDLIQAIKANELDFKKVRGIALRDGSNIFITPNAPNVMDLDNEMPGMAYHKLPMHLYRAHNWQCLRHPSHRQSYASMYTTLGCPEHCTFCPIQAPFKRGEEAVAELKGLKYNPWVNSYRKWSPQTVIKWFDTLTQQYNVDIFKIADEMFVYQNERHDLEIFRLLKDRGYGKYINVWAYSRVDSIGRPNAINILREGGMEWICVGFESASERVLQDVDKGYDIAKVHEVIKKIHDGGINVLANYLFGLPEDDFDTMWETLRQSMDLNCEYANFYSAMAYPGSELYRIAVRNQWPLPATWNGFSQHSVDTLPLPTNHITGSDVLAFRDYAVQTYFLNPRYLNMVLRKFGQESVDFVKAFANTKLKRDNVK